MIYINCDGGSKSNPGDCAIGIVIRDEKKNILKKYKEFIGRGTNNIAEYKSLIKALELAKEFTLDKIHVSMDSELVIRQVTGIYKIKKIYLYKLYEKVKELEKNFNSVTYEHVYRQDFLQTEADKLVNEAFNEKS